MVPITWVVDGLMPLISSHQVHILLICHAIDGGTSADNIFQAHVENEGNP